MKQEFCTRCNTKRNVKMTASSKVMTDPAGKRNEIRIKTFHCDNCKSFVRREKCIRGGLLKTRDRFTPIAKNIWRAIPGDTQLKILNTVWCTQCRHMARITHITAKVDSGMLVLRGECTRCSGDVARVIENE
jgi:hypothetical protein